MREGREGKREVEFGFNEPVRKEGEVKVTVGVCVCVNECMFASLRLGSRSDDLRPEGQRHPVHRPGRKGAGVKR